MNAAGDGQGKEALGASDQQGDGLTGVAVNEFRFVVVRGFLMQFFNRRHFATCFWQFDSIADEDEPAIDFRHQRVGQNRQNKATPKSGEGVNGNGLAVKKIEKPVIENLLQAYCPYEAGHASQIGATGYTDQTKGKPQEGSFPCKGVTHLVDHLQPLNPKDHSLIYFRMKTTGHYSIYML